MSGLILKLQPNERVLINGAVVENLDRRCKLSILTPKVNVLRLRDAIHPNDANTPVKSLCYLIQLVISGDAEVIEVMSRVLTKIDELETVFRSGEPHHALDLARGAIMRGHYYQGLRAARSLIPYESALLTQ